MDVTVHTKKIEVQVKSFDGTVWVNLAVTDHNDSKGEITLFVQDSVSDQYVGLDAFIAAVATLESQLIAVRDFMALEST